MKSILFWLICFILYKGSIIHNVINLCFMEGNRLMYNKDVINTDPETTCKIYYTTDPRKIKRLESSVSVMICNEWNTLKKTLMLELVRAKYTQNEDLKQILLDTGNQRDRERFLLFH